MKQQASADASNEAYAREAEPDPPRGPEPGRCSSCGRFVEDRAIICISCDVAERRREFNLMLP